jgi:protein-tyrosine phosphatase
MVSLYELAYGGPGRLATMAHPPGGERLAEAMAGLAEAGVDVLVSALREDEMTLLELTGEPAAAAAAGIEFVNLPILDNSVPEPSNAPAVRRLADRLAGELRADRFVVTHCRAGIGRCSMLAGATLVRGFRVDPAHAWELIRTARGLQVPDNPEQEAWLFRAGSL